MLNTIREKPKKNVHPYKKITPWKDWLFSSEL